MQQQRKSIWQEVQMWHCCWRRAQKHAVFQTSTQCFTLTSSGNRPSVNAGMAASPLCWRYSSNT